MRAFTRALETRYNCFDSVLLFRPDCFEPLAVRAFTRALETRCSKMPPALLQEMMKTINSWIRKPISLCIDANLARSACTLFLIRIKEMILLSLYSLGTRWEGDKETESKKRTTPGIPTWSPTVVLTRPEHA